jgi:cation diffusion facilitator family transporter
MPLRALARRFLPNTPTPEAVAGLVSVLVGAALLAVKFVAYYLTGSAAIFSDAMESIVNVLASAFAVYALFYAHRPADREHPYGHGKIEFLSAGFEGGMIFLAALVIAFRAVETMVRKPDLKSVGTGLVLMLAAMVVNGGLGLWLIRAGQRHKSLTLEADGKHLFSDAVTSAAAVVALGIVKWSGWWIVDPIFALLIAVYIVHTAVGLMRTSAAGLMDQQDLEDEKLLKQILDAHVGPAGKEPRICSYHKLRHRHSGRYHWIDFHLMVPADFTIDRGHAIASAIEYEIELALGEGNATAHVEPCKDPGCCGERAARQAEQSTAQHAQASGGQS